MYGTAALGNKGGNHTVTLLKTEIQQIMEQLCCERVEDLPNHLIKTA
jgi:L-lactate dehydrogenase (cytochrome)